MLSQEMSFYFHAFGEYLILSIFKNHKCKKSNRKWFVNWGNVCPNLVKYEDLFKRSVAKTLLTYSKI